MALIQCYECNGVVSTAAESCPHCGAPGPASAGKTPETVGTPAEDKNSLGARRAARVKYEAKARVMRIVTTVIIVVGWPLFIILMYLQSQHNPAGIFH